MWEACTNIPALNFQSVGSTRAKALRINFLALAAPCDTTIITSGKNKLFHDVLLLHQQKKKTTIQLNFLPRLIFLFLSVHMEGPQEAYGGVYGDTAWEIRVEVGGVQRHLSCPAEVIGMERSPAYTIEEFGIYWGVYPCSTVNLFCCLVFRGLDLIYCKIMLFRSGQLVLFRV